LIPPIERRRRVKFVFPNGPVYEFRLEDEVGVDASYSDIGDYRYLIQLLKSKPDGEELIRAAYYRRPPGSDRWYFASQTSLTAEREYWVALLAQGMKTPWFKSLVDDAANIAEAEG
jgi:hypothetical protein